MSKDEYTVYLCMYLNITAIHFKFGQHLYWIYTEGKSLIMELGPEAVRRDKEK